MKSILPFLIVFCSLISSCKEKVKPSKTEKKNRLIYQKYGKIKNGFFGKKQTVIT